MRYVLSILSIDFKMYVNWKSKFDMKELILWTSKKVSKIISDVAIQIWENWSMDWLISSSATLSWIHTVIHYSYSAAGGRTGSKRFTMKGMVSAFYTNGTKTDVSNGRGPEKKQNRSLISSSVGFWKVWIRSSQRRFKNGFLISLEILKILRNTGKSDSSMV